MRIVLLLLTLMITSPLLQAQGGNFSKGKLDVIEEPGIRQLQQSYIEENKKNQGIAGYRVQIYNGRKDACMDKRSHFISVFPTVAAYTLYEAPEYRIQVGDFRTRLEAEKFLQTVLSEFSGSFVVNTRIKLPDLHKTGVPKP